MPRRSTATSWDSRTGTRVTVTADRDGGESALPFGLAHLAKGSFLDGDVPATVHALRDLCPAQRMVLPVSSAWSVPVAARWSGGALSASPSAARPGMPVARVTRIGTLCCPGRPNESARSLLRGGAEGSQRCVRSVAAVRTCLNDTSIGPDARRASFASPDAGSRSPLQALDKRPSSGSGMAQRPRSVPRSDYRAGRCPQRRLGSSKAWAPSCAPRVRMLGSAMSASEASGLSKGQHSRHRGRASVRLMGDDWRVGAALGLRLTVGLSRHRPAIRDHIQSPMIGD